MNYLLSMFTVLLMGVIILMLGILMNQESGQSCSSALNDSIVWGMGFFVGFGGEFMLLANV